jgi:mandelamide amidase
MIPGGSSGGVAAAIAGFLMPAGIGTDTGASVRLPSALCGCVGFRPTVGRYRNSGIVPISHTRDTVGPIVRNVEDAALIDAVLAGKASTRLDHPGSIRIGVPRAYFYADLDSEVAAVTEQALARIAAAGIELVETDIPHVAELNAAVSAPVARFEFVRDLASYLKEHELHIDMQAVLEGVGSPDVRQVLTDELGSDATPEATYLRALTEDRPKLQRTYADYFGHNRLDAAIFPTAPLPARPIGHDEEVDLGGRLVSTFQTYIRNTDPASNAGIPGLSLPVGRTRRGLPVGMEIDGPVGSDRHLLRISFVLEEAFRATTDDFVEN